MSVHAALPLVHVVDDDAALRDSLQWLLESAGYRVALHTCGEAFLQATDIDAGACVLLDVRMPDVSGLGIQEALIARGCGLPIIFITGHGDVPMAVDAIKRGAMDFIEKPFNDEVLLARIDAAVRIDRQSRAARAARSLVAARIETLSPREREVMERVIAGKLNKVIAAELGIGMKTVEVHRARVMRKLAVGSVAELVQATLDRDVRPGP